MFIHLLTSLQIYFVGDIRWLSKLTAAASKKDLPEVVTAGNDADLQAGTHAFIVTCFCALYRT